MPWVGSKYFGGGGRTGAAIGGTKRVTVALPWKCALANSGDASAVGGANTAAVAMDTAATRAAARRCDRAMNGLPDSVRARPPLFLVVDNESITSMGMTLILKYISP